MRILLTNIELVSLSGTTTATRDLALALRRRGHTVICYSPDLGESATRIRATGTPVVDSIDRLGEAPDVIHGHHSGPTMVALTRFPAVPALFVCHDWSSVHDDPPLHPRIRRYGYVRDVLRERLVSERGIPPALVVPLNNAVDLERIGSAREPPAMIRTAGLYAHAGRVAAVDQIAEACRRRGITYLGDLLADSRDRGEPEQALARCDLVFASGRMAIEALASGCAVINADRFGVGGLVTGARFDAFAAANFAIGALSTPASAGLVADALAAYDAADAAAVTVRTRDACSVAALAERLEALYATLRSEAAEDPATPEQEALALACYLQDHLAEGGLYNRGFAQQAAGSTQALSEEARSLGREVRELASLIRLLARRRLGRASLLDRWQDIRRAMDRRWPRRPLRGAKHK